MRMKWIVLIIGILLLSGCVSQTEMDTQGLTSSVHVFIRDEHTRITSGPENYLGNAQLQLDRPGKVFVEANVSILPSSVPEWLGLTIRMIKGSTTVQLEDYIFTTPRQENYSSVSVAGILLVPEAGTWTVQCVLVRGETGPDITIHTYSLTAFELK